MNINKTGYQIYIDDNGKILQENDIYFATDELIKKREDPAKWGVKKDGQNYPNIFTPGITAADGQHRFPTIVKHRKTGKIANIKVTKDGMRLPIHAGSCKQVKGICFALPQTGKTTFYLQTIMNERFQNMLASNSNIYFQEDLTETTSAQKTYRNKMLQLEKNQILPDTTLPGQKVTYPYYIKGERNDILFSLTDVSGEECKQLNWNSNSIIMNDYFIIMIGADDILHGNRNYTYIISQLVSKLRIQRPERNYHILIVITKADLLDWMNDPFLKKINTNTIGLKSDGSMYQKIHKNGFSKSSFDYREQILVDYLYQKCPNLMNYLLAEFGRHVHFFATASIGCTPDETNHFSSEKYNPFSVDEPLLYILTKEKVFPEKNEEGVIDRFCNWAEKWINRLSDTEVEEY